MNYNWVPYPHGAGSMNYSPAMPWQHPQPNFYGNQVQHGQPGPFQYNPRPNGPYVRHPAKLANEYRPTNNSTRPKRPRKEPNLIDYCDVCNRGFKNNAKKIEHYQQHEKCDEPGCKFEAHFKLVSIHKENMHGPNALSIKVETPEEIKRWREARKRKYPSCSNIQKKAEKQSKREHQGNVLDNKDFGKMHKKKQNTSIQEVDKEERGATGISKPNQSTNQTDVAPISLLGLFSTPHDSSGGISSEDDDSTSHSDKNLSALGSLMQSYASESELEDNEASNVRHLIPLSNTGATTSQSSPDCTPEKTLTDTSNFRKKPGLQSRGNNKSNKPQGQNCHLRGKKRQSLLEMLLANDIRKERNHILQCVRYVVKNNFFESDLLVSN